ncbi:helix-turn-helix domain-containing protein [Pararobbsia silviterrae]|nr:helix-turn-helix domain-containing protein [Pararobbsia silviterrae]
MNATARPSLLAPAPTSRSAGHVDERLTWLDVETRDADDAAGIQRGWMPIEYDQIDAGAFSGRFRQLGFQDMLVAAERQNRTVLKQQYFPSEYCTVSLIRSVSGQGRCGLDALTPGSIGYMPGDKDYEVLLPPSEIVFFRIEQERLLSAADTLGYALPGAGRQMLFLTDLDSSGIDDMAETLMSIQRSDAAAPFAQVDHAYLNKVMLDRIVGMLVDSTARSARMPWINAHRVTRSAQALIDSQSDEPVTVMTLCEALGVSRTLLQRSFLQIYGVSPLAYLRARRLNGARRALKAARGTDATVAAIAMHWGFFHFARFSQDYFQQFGEFPSATLGRGVRPKRDVRAEPKRG